MQYAGVSGSSDDELNGRGNFFWGGIPLYLIRSRGEGRAGFFRSEDKGYKHNATYHPEGGGEFLSEIAERGLIHLIDPTFLVRFFFVSGHVVYLKEIVDAILSIPNNLTNSYRL